MRFSGGTTEYLPYAVHEDFQSTVWGLSNTSAVVKERFLYKDAFGVSNTLNAAGSDIGEFATNVYFRKRLHGGVTDSVSLLIDYRFRSYEPSFGAFVSRDPLGVSISLNPYQAFLGTPGSITDTFGLFPQEPGRPQLEKEKQAFVQQTDEWEDWLTVETVLGWQAWVGLADADKADKCADDTDAAIRYSGNQVNCDSNAVKHCVLACELGKTYGTSARSRKKIEATLAIHEVGDLIVADETARRMGGAAGASHWMNALIDSELDFFWNGIGLLLSDSADSSGGCCCACREKAGCPCVGPPLPPPPGGDPPLPVSH